MRRRRLVTAIEDLDYATLMAEACPALWELAPVFDSGIPLTARDHLELGKALLRVFDILRDGHVHTVAEIAHVTGDPQASVSANCRNLRKVKHGGHNVRLVQIAGRTFGYQLVR